MNPIILMMAITTPLDRKTLDEKFLGLGSVGIGGIMIYPRSGLEVGYMSDEWRAQCEDIILSAKEHGLKVWLYDDFNWPSGSCKNTVVKENPDFAARRFIVDGGRVSVERIAEGGAEMVFNPFETDMLNPDAIDCFIRLTHEKYLEWLGDYFGNVIEGIFTDEPSFIYTCRGKNMLPYYDGIYEDYERAYGRELESDMTDHMKGADNGFPERFYPLISSRFKAVYFKKISDFCHKHGLKSTGHLMEDRGVCENIVTTGCWFDAAEELDVPGIDNIESGSGHLYDAAYAKLEALRRFGKSEAMNEVFALGPCSMSYARRVKILWHSAAFGINRFFFAISHTDAKGNAAKPDFFNNFSEANPDFAAMVHLAKEAERAAVFANKEALSEVAVEYPYTACLRAMSKRRENEVEERYRTLIDALTDAQIPWRVIREGEPCGERICIGIEESRYTVRGYSASYPELETLLCEISGKVKRYCIVTEDGKPAKDVFVKTYTDASVLIINRSEENKKRQLELRRDNGQTLFFSIEYEGVRTADIDSVSDESPILRSLPVEICSAYLDRENLYRPYFFTDTAKVKVSEPVSVRIHKRAYPGGEKVLLDGEEILCRESSDALGECFSPLYKASAKILLAAGEHTFGVSANENPHLPALILSGDFSAEDNKLTGGIDLSKPIYFYGMLTVKIAFTVPKGAKRAYVSLGDNNIFASVDIGGQSSERILPPFDFKIPEGLFGKKITANVSAFSSLSPIFGNLKAIEKEHSIRADWVKEADIASGEFFDPSKIKICYEE